MYSIKIIFSPDKKYVMMEFNKQLNNNWFIYTQCKDKQEAVYEMCSTQGARFYYIGEHRIHLSDKLSNSDELHLLVSGAISTEEFDYDKDKHVWININDIDYLLQLPGNGICYVLIEQARRVLGIEIGGDKHDNI